MKYFTYELIVKRLVFRRRRIKRKYKLGEMYS